MRTIDKLIYHPSLANAAYRARQYLQTTRSVVADFRNLLKKPYKDARVVQQDMSCSQLYLGTTNVCNARCVFCIYKNHVGPRGVMTFEIARKAMDEYVEMGGRLICFSPTLGEPLLDPGLMEKIQYAVQLPRMGAYIFTNGSLLVKNEAYKELVDSGIRHITISMGETDRDRYAEGYGVDLYPQVIDGVHRLMQYNKERGEKTKVTIAFRSTTAPASVVQSPDFKQYIKPFLSDRVDFNFMQNYDNWGGAIRPKDLRGIMQLRRIPRVKKHMCLRTLDLLVLYEGSVRLCGCRCKETEFDDLVVGNIQQDSLKNLYWGPKAQEIRDSFAQNQLREVCKDCSLYMPSWILK